MRTISSILLHGRLYPIVPLFLELDRELLTALFDDPATGKNVDHVGHNKIEQPLVVGDEDNGIVGASQGVDPLCDDPEGVDVETRIGFVEHRELWLKNGHLQDLVPLFLAARKTLIDRSL